MRRLHLAALAFAVSTSACVANSTAEPEYPADDLGKSHGPTYDEYDAKSQPTYAGPPGGSMDREWQYATPAEEAVPTADQDAINAESDGYYGAHDPYASANLAVEAPVADPAQLTANVTDGEIDQTLQAYGEWIETAEYGVVWRPYTTVVGADFTPYETCGQWVWTDFGWTFSCDWTWGWLPFHYGNWVTVGDTWCWSRGYEWSPAWVDWRHGRDYIGWRPRHPRGRPSHVGHWSWGHTDDFGGSRPVRPRRINDAIGVRSTVGVKVPPVRGNRPERVDHVMGGRGVVGNAVRNPGSFGRPSPTATVRPDRPSWNRPRNVQPPRDLRPGYNAQGPGTYRPTTNPRPTYQNPRSDVAPFRPAPTRPSSSPPSRSDYTPSSRPSLNYSPPSRPSNHSRPSAPSRPSSPPPSRPSSSSSPPSRPSSSYAPPSRPSPSSSRPSSPSRSSGSFTPSRSSGGGGGRRR